MDQELHGRVRPPTQILFGSRKWRYCVVSHLGSWLELHFELNPKENEFIFAVKGAVEPDAIQATAAYHLREIIKNDAFVLNIIDKI